MTDDVLNKANELKEEINKLDHFIRYANLTWRRLSIFKKLRKGKAVLHHKGYGAFGGGDYEMPEELCEKVICLLEKHLEELWEEYKKLN